MVENQSYWFGTCKKDTKYSMCVKNAKKPGNIGFEDWADAIFWSWYGIHMHRVTCKYKSYELTASTTVRTVSPSPPPYHQESSF
jgi:hypothetical protein